MPRHDPQCVHEWEDNLYDGSRYECTKCPHWLTTEELNAMEVLYQCGKAYLERVSNLEPLLVERALYSGYTILGNINILTLKIYDAVQAIEKERR